MLLHASLLTHASTMGYILLYRVENTHLSGIKVDRISSGDIYLKQLAWEVQVTSSNTVNLSQDKKIFKKICLCFYEKGWDTI